MMKIDIMDICKESFALNTNIMREQTRHSVNYKVTLEEQFFVQTCSKYRQFIGLLLNIQKNQADDSICF